ncbi:MAG: glycosyltransferase [Candidatus Saganbacteria bacterium]|nr:glycosyltransferase [Candidatus Saganbacteria bacterium]
MLISVIIPVYNRRVMVQEAIASVLAQDYPDIELIIVEDGSDPIHRMSPPRTMKEMVRYYYRPHRGVASARNFGASVANGTYLAFLDSDDLWDKHKLVKQLRLLKEHPEYRVCYTNERWYLRGEHLNQSAKHAKQGGWIFKRCLPLCLISASSILMEKKVFLDLGGFDESLPVCEDYDLWLRLTLKYQIGYIDEPLVFKRGGRPDQLSKKYWGMDRFRVRALEKLLKQKLDDQKENWVRKELAFKYSVLIKGCWKHGRYFRLLYYWFRGRMALRG